jgi:hypothetical protein
MSDPGKLVTLGRLAVQKKLTRVLESDKQLERARVGELGKMLQVLEAYYGGSTYSSADDARRFVDRLEWLQEISNEMQRRRAPIAVEATVTRSTQE